VNFRVHLALVFLLDPSLGGGVEQIEGELGLALEHGQEAALICPQNDSCFPFCSGEYGSVV